MGNYILYVDNVKLYMEDVNSDVLHSAVNIEGPSQYTRVITSHLSLVDDLYQLVEARGMFRVAIYSLKSNSRAITDLIVTPSSIHSKFIKMFHSKSTESLYLIELNVKEGSIGFLSLRENNVTNHGSFRHDLRSQDDISCTFKNSRDCIECILQESEQFKIVEILIDQSSFRIQKESFYPIVPNKQIMLMNGFKDSSIVALKRDGEIVFYSVLPNSWIEIGKVHDNSEKAYEQYDTIEDSFLVENNQMIIVPKTDTFSPILKKTQFSGNVVRRMSPKIESIVKREVNPELSSVNIMLKGRDLIKHMLGAKYTDCKINKHSRFNPSCDEGYHCLTFSSGTHNRDDCLNDEKISLIIITSKPGRKTRSKFVNQFQSIHDVTSTMILSDTRIPSTTDAPIFSIVSTSQGSVLNSFSNFNLSTLNERRSMLSYENNIISDVLAFADFTLGETSMGNSIELWLVSTDGKHYLSAQVTQFGVGRPVRIQTYPNLPGDLMTATRRTELETDRVICNEVKLNTMYRLIIQLTNPKFSDKTGLPLWRYRAAIVEPTLEEFEICSQEQASTMKKDDYEKIQDSKFAVGISQSSFSRLFSPIVTSLNVSVNIKAVGMRCQSESCKEIYIIPSMDEIIMISASLGSSLLFVLIVICLMVSIMLCIIRPWHVELTEEQKKEMELKKNFERLQQLQRTMSSGHAHSPVRSNKAFRANYGTTRR